MWQSLATDLLAGNGPLWLCDGQARYGWRSSLASGGALVSSQGQRSRGRGGDGHREEIALAVVTPERRQMIELRLRLDAFRDHVETQIVRQIHDGADDLGTLTLCPHLAHERPIDLQRIEGKAVHVAERGVAGPEVVDRELDAELLQLR